MADASA